MKPNEVESKCNREKSFKKHFSSNSLLFSFLSAEAKLHFGIYDFEGNGKVDCVRLGDLIRSLDLAATNAAIEKAGGTKKKGTKKHPNYSDGQTITRIMENCVPNLQARSS